MERARGAVRKSVRQGQEFLEPDEPRPFKTHLHLQRWQATRSRVRLQSRQVPARVGRALRSGTTLPTGPGRCSVREAGY